MRHLYFRKGEEFAPDLQIKQFTPSFKNGFRIKSEELGTKNLMVRLMFYIITAGKAKIFYIDNDNGEIMHTSYVIPRCVKFPFMGKNDYQIGPCHTPQKYRGQGLYPRTVRYICSCLNEKEPTFYMIVHDSNKASIRGIEKAGFEKCGELYQSKILKRYIKIN